MSVNELRAVEGSELGPSSWHVVDQSRIDAFAAVTGDAQWIHVDPVAAASGPFGGTLAHGYLTLSMVPMLLDEMLDLNDATTVINVGAERIRFSAPVPVGASIRLHARLASVRQRAGSVVYRVDVRVEIRGEGRPALAARVVYLAR